MRERILDRLDDRLVELGLLALHLDATCLPQVSARSRTTRGSFFQTLPIGCMRVFMTPSCSSVVIRFSRCDVAEKLVVVQRRQLQDLVARQHQLADQVHQLVEQADVDAQVRVGDVVRALIAGGLGGRMRGGRRGKLVTGGDAATGTAGLAVGAGAGVGVAVAAGRGAAAPGEGTGADAVAGAAGRAGAARGAGAGSPSPRCNRLMFSTTDE